jgi:hypothetical protein
VYTRAVYVGGTRAPVLAARACSAACPAVGVTEATPAPAVRPVDAGGAATGAGGARLVRPAPRTPPPPVRLLGRTGGAIGWRGDRAGGAETRAAGLTGADLAGTRGERGDLQRDTSESTARRTGWDTYRTGAETGSTARCADESNCLRFLHNTDSVSARARRQSPTQTHFSSPPRHTR